MKAVILAEDLGARISEEATIKPKPMDPRRDKNHLEELWQAGKAL